MEQAAANEEASVAARARPQQGQAGPPSEDELEMTNCSETMMSSADEQDEKGACDGAARRRQSAEVGHSTIEQQRLQSGRNRLGTPRHGSSAATVALDNPQASLIGAAQTPDCDRLRPVDLINRASASSLARQQDQEQPTPDSRQDESSEMSMASGQNQGPPSYGTATRSCATLDVGQLQQLHLRRLQAQQLSRGEGEQSRAAPVTSQLLGGRTVTLENQPTEPSMNQSLRLELGRATSLNYVSLGNLVALLKQQQRQDQNGHDAHQQGLPGRPPDDSYGFLRPDKNQQQWRAPRQMGLDLAAPSATFQRQVDLAAFAVNGGRNGRREEGIYATLNVTQASNSSPAADRRSGPGQPPPPSSAPINHVISARASMQLQPQQQLRTPLWNQSAAITQPQANQSTGAIVPGQEQHRRQPNQQQQAERLVDIYCATSSGAAAGRHWPAELLLARDGQPAQSSATAPAGGQQKCRANDFGASGAVTNETAPPTSIINDAFLRLSPATKTTTSDKSCSHPNNNCQSLTAARQAKQRRRRHKSTSGGICGMQVDFDTPQRRVQDAGAQSDAPRSEAGPATISAHCWLIDSGDERQQRRPAELHPAQTRTPTGQRSRGCEPAAQERQRWTRPKERLTTRSSQTLKMSERGGRRLAGPNRRRQNRVFQSSNTSLSLPDVAGLERDARDEDEDEEEEEDEDELYEQSDEERAARRGRKRARPSRSTSSYSNASAVVKLSAVLSFVSGLVGGGGGGGSSNRSSSSTGRRRKASSVLSSARSGASSTAAARYALGGLNSLSTSYGHESGPREQYNGAPSSLAYSSSTSAYVTGNSSLHSHDCGSSFVHVQHASLAQSDQAASYKGRQLSKSFLSSPIDGVQRYKSSATQNGTISDAYNAQQQQQHQLGNYKTTISHHSYEYCDQDAPSTKLDDGRLEEQIEMSTLASQREDGFGRAKGQTRERRANSSNHSLDDDGPAESCSESTCSPAQLVGLNQTGLVSGGPGDRSRLAQVLQSDNELITASNVRHANSLPARQRRRWWWNSFKFGPLRRFACRQTRAKIAGRAPTTSTDEDDNESLTHNRPAGVPNANSSASASATGAGLREPATRYRPLKASRSRRPRSSRSPSTLANVISLAKIDRVFRCRLLASLLVSALLLVLICLLAAIILRRGSMFSSLYAGGFGSGARPLPVGQSAGAVGLSGEESPDYDMSWLWPQPQPQQASIEELDQRKSADANLRSLLHVIDRSERLERFQTSLAHLSNLQLAGDHYIDVTDLALEALTTQADPGGAAQNFSDIKTANSTSGQAASRMNQNFVELFSLTLLSNLHWPLVKWRHQSQQSTAANSFLSFALPSSGSSRANLLTAGDGGGLQTIRSLLSSLILVETLSPQTTSNYANLRQFHRLHLSLRLASYHLATCALELQEEAASGDSPDNDQTPASRHFRWYRTRFCTLLVRRYKRMMMAMSQLDQQDFVALHQHQQIELPTSVFAAKTEDSPTSNGKAKTIVGFLLDRLALIDIHTLAELALVAPNSEPESAGGPSLLAESLADASWPTPPEDLSEELTADAPKNSANLIALLESITTNQGQLDVRTGALVQALAASHGDADAKPAQVYELVKTLIGDAPIKRLIFSQVEEGHEENVQRDWSDDYLEKFSKLRRDEEGRARWLDLLAFDLFTPWPAHLLPTFMAVHNYDLFLHPNLTTRLVLGVNKIEFELERPTSFLVLNCAQLNLIDLSVWRSQPLVGAINSKQSKPKSELSTMDRQVAIKRVLRLEQQEMLFIELEEQLEPVASLSQARAGTLGRVSFGELPQSADVVAAEGIGQAAGNNEQKPLRAFVRNRFMLNVSFNKTSLMGAKSAGQGLEFVRYSDYFGAINQQQQQPRQAQQVYRSSAPGDEQSFRQDDEGSARTLMFSTFNALPSSTRANQWQNAHQARQLFPCLDEPKFRARWQLNVVHDASSQALSNGQRRERLQYNSVGSLQMTIFEQTPVPLSPNLLAVLVCDQNNIRSLTSRLSIPSDIVAGNPQEAVESGGQRQHIQVQLWAQFELLGQAELASQLVPQLLTFYQSHLNFVYPLDKLDIVALPDGRRRERRAMDEISTGLGLLLLRGEQRPLADANLISQDLIEHVSGMIARQLAEQFLGNIVAPQNVESDKWLFAALAEHLRSSALGQVQSEWHLDEQFAATSLRETLVQEQTDEITNSKGPAELLDLSSGAWLSESPQAPPSPRSELTDRKSAAIVHMLLQTLLPVGEAQARLLRSCLKSFQYGTMNVVQFWRLFNQQLLVEGSPNRPNSVLLAGQAERQNLDAQHVTIYSAESTDEPDLEPAGGHNASAKERVVFVSRRRHQSANKEAESRRISSTLDEKVQPDDKIKSKTARRPTSGRLVDRLGQIAELWLHKPGFPLISASCYRDTLQLRQDSFKFSARWLVGDDEAASLDSSRVLPPTATRRRRKRQAGPGDPTFVWPVPLMFISRVSPRSARFVWFDQREMELQLDGGSLVEHATPTNYSSQMQPHYSLLSATGPAAGKLPQQYSWFKLNHNGSSLARVNYDERNWEALISLLTRAHYSNHVLNQLDRANLLDDAMTLMRYGQLSVNLAMNLTLYLELGERDYQPWQTVLSHLDQLQALLNQNPLWHQYVLKLIQPISIVVGWKDDGPHLMRKLRRELYQVAIQYGDDKVVAKARQDFKSWMLKAGQFIVPNLQELVYVAGVRYGDQQEWFHCWQKYQQLVAAGGPSEAALESARASPTSAAGQQGALSDLDEQLSNSQLLQAAARSSQLGLRRPPVPEAMSALEADPDVGGSGGGGLLENEKRQLLTALASTQNTWLLEQFLNYSLDSSKIQPHHLHHVVRTLGKNPVARLYLWRFVRLNWLELLDRFGQQQHEPPLSPAELSTSGRYSILETMILESTKHFATKLDYEEVSAFFGGKSKLQASHLWPATMTRAIRESLATIRANINWRNSIEPKLTRWLSHYNSVT